MRRSIQVHRYDALMVGRAFFSDPQSSWATFEKWTFNGFNGLKSMLGNMDESLAAGSLRVPPITAQDGDKSMKRIKFVSLTVGVLALTAASLALARAQQPMPDKIVVPLFGTTSVSETSGTIGENLLAPTEIQKPKKLGESPLRLGPPGVAFGRTAAGMGTVTSSGKKAKSNPNLLFGFEGVNHRDQRLADNGNQFNWEPADQGLCVGNGYLMETVNRALRIYDAVSGAELTPVLSLNEFYGFPPLIDRGTGVYGPNIYNRVVPIDQRPHIMRKLNA
jgi:hypothetical protein